MARAARSATLTPGLTRPQPPVALLAAWPPAFVPVPELDTWARAAFIADGAPLFNPDHRHLERAAVGWLWTNVPYTRQQRVVAGTAEILQVQGGAWKRGRAEQQLRNWFGDEPDFVITLHAPTAAELDDASFCALVEHELYHCAQARDQYGAPRFNQATGLPIWAIRAHDAEEFTGVVRRYGAGSAAGGVAELVRAAQRPPEIAAAAIAGACGTCLARVA